MENNQEFKHIVRVADTDMSGNKLVGTGLTKIKGVSFMFSNMVCKIAGVDQNKRIGNLTDAEIKKLDEIFSNPSAFSAPSWMFNRKKDPEDGKDKHLLTADLTFVESNDIKMMRKMKSYKGIRHSFGLPVRGQKTRSNSRKNKGKVSLGVKKPQVGKV